MTKLQQPKTKAMGVRTFILNELKSGNYQKGDQFFSENELSNTLNLSKTTIREAVSSLVGEGLLVRLRGSGTFVKALPCVNEKEVDLLVGDPKGKGVEDIFIASLLSGLHFYLDSRKWIIRVKTFKDLYNPVPAISKMIEDDDLATSVLLAGFTFTREVTELIQSSGRRIVCVGRPEDETLSFVHNDHHHGMRLTLDYLIKRGHKKIALIDRQVSHSESFNERHEAYLNVLPDYGIVPDARLLVTFTGFDAEAGRAAVRQLNSRGVDYTAAIVAGDWATYGVQQELMKQGRRIPEDVSLVCYGKVLPGITSVETRIPILGQKAAQLVGDISGELDKVCFISPTLIEGESVADYSLSTEDVCETKK